MKNNSGEINAIIYSVGNQVFFLTSEVITSGIFIARNNNRETIIKCDIDHTNYGCLLLNEEIKAGENSLTFSIISNEIIYEKKLEWKNS